jgi:hypothetical protein
MFLQLNGQFYSFKFTASSFYMIGNVSTHSLFKAAVAVHKASLGRYTYR